jgi:hypothetical protein
MSQKKRDPGKPMEGSTGAGTSDAGQRLGQNIRTNAGSNRITGLQLLRATRIMHRWGLTFGQASAVAGLAYGERD